MLMKRMGAQMLTQTCGRGPDHAGGGGGGGGAAGGAGAGACAATTHVLVGAS
ncbi:hypothetical protein SKC41_22760 [Mycobacterium sp. 050128]|uniref:hypothetical protein n=1 Tax=Mycobacterium sp. 050128 TaxID=3096112 RepID=UPI002EDB69D0